MNVYVLDLTSVSEREVSEYAHVLDRDRQKRIAQYGRSADKRRSFGAGMTLLYAWKRQYPGREMPETARDGNGKPYFIGETISFCLSHSGKYAACALAERIDSGIGLDIQEPRRVHPGIAARFFSDGEREQLRAGGDPCLIWSRKESLAKYLGSGLRGDLRLLDTADGAECQYDGRAADVTAGIQCSRGTDSAAQIHDGHNTDSAAQIWSCRTKDGYAVSVCTKERTVCRLVRLHWEQIREIL